MKKALVIHPFLFALFPVLFLLDHNKGLLLIDEDLINLSVLALAVTSYAAFLLWLLLSRAIRDREKTGLLVSLLLVLFFSYGHIRNLAGDIDFVVAGIRIGPDKFLFLLCAVLLVLGVYFCLRTRRNLYNFTTVLNIVAGALVLNSLVGLAAFVTKKGLTRQDSIRVGGVAAPTAGSTRPDQLPDIYYIVLDRYGSDSTLKEFYDFDNNEFIDYLTQKGFYVASQSCSNYLLTSHSLASSLNMEFINYLSQTAGGDSNDWTPVYKKVQDFKVQLMLKAKGYKYIHLGSWWDPTRQNPFADMNINKFRLPEFAVILIRSTLAYPLLSTAHVNLFTPNVRKSQQERVPYIFDRLAEIPRLKEPTFVFAHILIPHPPYVFDRNGNFLSEAEANRRSRTLNYVDQVIFTNQKSKILIDKLLSGSPTPPIILLQGDEGPYPLNYELNEEDFDWRQASKEELREKMRILNAYYLPQVDKSVLYPSISPVNSFRLVFNLYFGEHFELLPDESYAFVDRSHIYKFFNVTNKLR
jgi:hypothetical protein